MSDIRDLGDDLKASILSNDSFLYAHLVKFERTPRKEAVGAIANKASDFSYITDASINISFDDGSKNVSGGSNGAQVYVANRLESVTNMQETTEAKVSNVTIKLSSIALNSQFTGSTSNQITVSNSGASGCTISMVDTAGNENWTSLGFSEGDRLLISSGDANNGKSISISRFENNNYRIIGILPDEIFSNSASRNDYNITLDTDEITAVLDDPTAGTYNGYINRDVTIYRAHIDPDTGVIIGSPYLIFKGIISKAKLVDDPTKDSMVTWTLTSHWGDFIRVNGRITSDSEHRAIGTSGVPDLAALHRDDYAFDRGFMHGEQAINIISIYQVQETRYREKRTGLLKLRRKLEKYEVTVDRDVDLRFNLTAKALPVIYGVGRVDSIPVFADTLHADASKIYCVYAICEGEVSGLFDIYVDDQSRICVDKNDADTRTNQTEDQTIDVLCEGRMDKGDTLSSAASTMNSTTRANRGRGGGFNVGTGTGNFEQWLDNLIFAANDAAGVGTTTSATGITHERKTTLEYPISAQLIFHSGKSHQRADALLSGIANAGVQNTANGFKLQADSENQDEYWGENHRLLDTAYVVAEYEIAEGDITIPNLEFVVRGREVEQYNYDFSYRDHPNPSFASGTIADKRDLFKLGDVVDIYDSTDNSALAQNITIQDKYSFFDASNTEIFKFRFSSNPMLKADGTVSSCKEFHMVADGTSVGSDSKYPMITWDYQSHTGSVAETLVQDADETAGNGNVTVANTSTGGGTGVDLTEFNAILSAILLNGNAFLSYVLGGQTLESLISEFINTEPDVVPDGSAAKVPNNGSTQVGKANIQKVGIANAVKLASGASSTDDFYNGQTITVTHTEADGTQKTQSRKIVDYIGSTRVALTGSVSDMAGNSSTIGTYTAASASYVQRSVVLNNVTNIVAGHILQQGTDGLSTIPAGTKILVVNGGNNTITTDKIIKVSPGASLIVKGPGTETTKVTGEPFEFFPQQGDTYVISGAGDKKTSINPAVQLLDYITNKRFGRGLDRDKDIRLETFQESARLCDTRSDVTMSLLKQASDGTTYVAPSVGDVYKYTTSATSASGTDFLQFQGTVKTVSSPFTYIDDTSEGVPGSGTNTYVEVVFTDVIGKINQRWYDWKSYNAGDVLYHRVSNSNRSYLVGTTGTIAQPTNSSTAISSIALTKVSGSGASSLFVHMGGASGTTERESGEQLNPIVKSFNFLSNAANKSFTKSGYSLYDSDDVKYWRYTGWQNHHQREVTRHQTNSVLRTSSPLFDNVNSLLGHFNGILRYSNGKYELAVETTAPTIASTLNLTTSSSYTGTGGASTNITTLPDPRLINQDDIIGAISVDDAGLKGSCNTVSVEIPDPQIRYDTRGVSFFKSEYLKEDKNIPKKKDIKTPYISNYFNARINAEQYLDQSRFNRKINFVLGPRGALLQAGSIIKITYPRFGWVNKDYRISNLTFNKDCTVQVTAFEHSDNTYIVEAKEKDPFLVMAPSVPGDESVAPGPPTSVTATGQDNSILIAWKNNISFGNPTSDSANPDWKNEVWVNDHSSFTNTSTAFPNGAKKIHTNFGEQEFEHSFPAITADTTRYYWVRHGKTITKKSTGSRITLFSKFSPLNTSSGTAATAVAATGAGAGIVYLYKSSVSEPTDDPSADSTFPTLVVDLSGANAGKITGVKSGQGLAAFATNQVIDTSGAATGWYTVPQNPTDDTHVIWIIAATASSTGASDEILRAEWTEPVKFSGAKGLNSATVRLFQLNNNASSPTTARPSGDLTYTFSPPGIAGSNFNQWLTTASNTTSSNRYLWTITAAAISNGSTTTVAQGDWSTAVIQSNFAVDGADSTVAGPDGDDAARVVTGYVYWKGAANASKSTVQAAVTAIQNAGPTYTFTSTFADTTFNPDLGQSLGSNHDNFSISPPEANSTRQTVFYAPFTATETVSSGNATGVGPVTFGAVSEGINFSGVVTFSGTGNTTITAPGGESLDITQIDGSLIKTGRIESVGMTVSGNKDGSNFTSEGTYFQLANANSGNDKAGSIASEHFRLEGDGGKVQIKGETTGTGGGSILLDSTEQKITITDGTVDRVVIGKLT